MKPKSIFASRTFWLNILGTATAIATSGIIPPKYSMPAMAVANIGIRLITNQPASIVPPAE
jgi:hypothetical protein